MTVEHEKIWPKPIPIIGLTGEYASGKTLFSLMIDPARTLVFDEEKSSQTYDDLGFTRVDILDEVRKKSPNGFGPLQVFEYFRDRVKAIKPGEYSVIVCDTVGLIEAGLADWVEAHPEEFGKSKAQYLKAQALFWGDVKEYWKVMLADISTRCQTFCFTVHMGAEFKNGAPTGKRKPKGKETLMELASLFLQMERKIDANTKQVPSVPSAVVLKSRLAKAVFQSNGEIKMIPLVPPRIPRCTPQSIRDYINNPPDWAKLSADEQVAEEKLSDDEKLKMELERSKAIQGAEEAMLERQRLKGGVSQSQQVRNPPSPSVTAPITPNGSATTAITAPAPSTNGTAKHEVAPGKTTPQQIERIKELRASLFVSKGLNQKDNKEECTRVWEETLKPYGVKSVIELSEQRASDLIAEMEKTHDVFTAGPSPASSAT